MGAERLEVLLQESLAVAVKSLAIDVKDLSKVIVDTTVQEKAITFPTDAKLMNRAREKLVKLAEQHGLKLRQGYPKVGTLALIEYQRYAHAKQFKRARRELRRLRTFLGRVMRDIERQVQGGLRSTTSSDACFSSPAACMPRSAASAEGRSTRCMRPSRMHWQGQGTQALRVRRQGVGGDYGGALSRRPVRAGREGAAGQPL